MMRRYVFVAALGLAGAIVTSILLGLPAPHPAVPAVPPPPPAITLAVDVFPDRVVSSPAALPVGATVELSAHVHSDVPVRLALAGYEDRVSAARLASDTPWNVTFVADRPGEMAWLVNGEPEGRLDVRGNHLVEGHR